MEDNPFAGYGKVVHGDSFVGREKFTEAIEQRVLSDSFGNLSIVGLPRIGKSSLAHQALYYRRAQLWEEKRFIIEKLSLKTYESPKDFYLGLMLRVKKSIKEYALENSALLEALEEYYEEIKEPSIAFVELEDCLLSFFSDITTSGIRVIVILDEFDYVKEVMKEIDYQMLRTLSYESDNQIAFVTTSRRSIFDIERYSGQGSNFFGTFENIRLGVFTEDEAKILFAKANIDNEEEINEIRSCTGEHPYLLSMVLFKYQQSKGKLPLKEIIDEALPDVLRYHDDIFYVLGKDNLADKVIKIYCGILEGVPESDKEYIMNYGLFIRNQKNEMVPFSELFNSYLNLKWREISLKDMWSETETLLRKIITKCMLEIYGSDWEDALQRDIPKSYIDEDTNLVAALRSRREKERKYFKGRASSNILDQLYPRHYSILLRLHWDKYYKKVFDGERNYWNKNLEFMAQRFRNPISHSRDALLNDDEKNKAAVICKEIMDKIKAWLSSHDV